MFSRLYAKLFGYEWLTCPLCKREFGGHQLGAVHDLRYICRPCARSKLGILYSTEKRRLFAVERYEFAKRRAERTR
jgi:hypothetical protein